MPSAHPLVQKPECLHHMRLCRCQADLRVSGCSLHRCDEPPSGPKSNTCIHHHFLSTYLPGSAVSTVSVHARHEVFHLSEAKHCHFPSRFQVTKPQLFAKDVAACHCKYSRLASRTNVRRQHSQLYLLVWLNMNLMHSSSMSTSKAIFSNWPRHRLLDSTAQHDQQSAV